MRFGKCFKRNNSYYGLFTFPAPNTDLPYTYAHTSLCRRAVRLLTPVGLMDAAALLSTSSERADAFHAETKGNTRPNSIWKCSGRGKNVSTICPFYYFRLDSHRLRFVTVSTSRRDDVRHVFSTDEHRLVNKSRLS